MGGCWVLRKYEKNWKRHKLRTPSRWNVEGTGLHSHDNACNVYVCRDEMRWLCCVVVMLVRSLAVFEHNRKSSNQIRQSTNKINKYQK